VNNAFFFCSAERVAENSSTALAIAPAVCRLVSALDIYAAISTIPVQKTKPVLIHNLLCDEEAICITPEKNQL
jgi:hypothetical protein